MKIFSSIPEYKRNRIIGTETEHGVENPRYDLLLGFLPNGGRVYKDNDYHIEYCTPETRSPLAATLWELAGESICLPFAEHLYKHNVDSENNSWGSHENYFTTINYEKAERMIPFLITRQLFAGAGWYKEGVFRIAQRPQFITHVITMGTQEKSRGIICTKDEPLSSVKGWRRLHLILGDANRCPLATYVKLGTTALVLDLIEDDLLPDI